MAKLSIGIGVDLGNSVQTINGLVSAFDTLNTKIASVSSNLSALKNIKVSFNVNEVANQPVIKPLIDITEFSKRIADAKVKVNADIDLKVDKANLDFNSKWGPILQKAEQDAKRTATNINTSLNSVGQNAPKALNAASVGFNKLSGVGNQANMVITNFGRIAQDSAFGVLGISNNIVPLIESFAALRTQAAATGVTMRAALISSLTGPGGLILAFSAVTAALSFASVGLSYWIRNSSEAKQKTDILKNAINDLQKNNIKNAADELAKSQLLYAISQDLNRSLSVRTEAVKALQSIYPDYFGNIKKETILAGEAEVAYIQLTKSILNKARVEAASQKITEIFKSDTYIEARGQLEDLNVEYDTLFKSLNKVQRKVKDGKYLGDVNIGFTSTEQSKDLDILSNKILKLKETIKPFDDKAKEIIKGLRAEDGFTEAFIDGKNEGNSKKLLKDLFAELQSKLDAIKKTGTLNPLQKAEESANAIDNGLKNILENYKDAFKDVRFKEFEKIFREKQQLIIELKYKQSFDEIFSDIQKLSDLEAIDGKSRTEDKLKRLIQGSGYLLDNFNELAKKDPKFEGLTNLINDLQQNKGLESVVDTFNSINNSISQIQKRGDILNISTTEDKIKALKDGIEKIILISQSGLFKDTTIQPFFELLFKNIQDRINKLDIKKFKEQIKGIEFKNFLIGDPATAAKEKADVFKQKLNEEISKPIKDFDKIFALTITIKKLEADEKALKDAEKLADTINSTIQDGLIGIGQALGEAIGSGGNVFKALKNSLLESLGNLMIAIGKQLVIANKLVEAAKKAFAQGPIGIIAGIALITAGFALKESIKTKLATGGKVRGPGTSTSDSIPALLSDGEYVIKASSVSKYGSGFLDAINAGRFASGGLVGDYGLNPIEAALASNSKALVNRMPSMPNTTIKGSSLFLGSSFGQNSGYIAETKISGQDLKLVLTRADRRFNNVT